MPDAIAPTTGDVQAWLTREVGLDWRSQRANRDHPFAIVWTAIESGMDAWAAQSDQALPRVASLVATLGKLASFQTRDSDGQISIDGRFARQLIHRAKLSVAEFDSVELEAVVAWGLSGEARLDVRAISTCALPTPDFEVALETGNVFVECKARTTLTPQHQRIDEARAELCARLAPLVKRSPVNCGVVVKTDGVPDRRRFRELLQWLAPLLASGRPFSGNFESFEVSGAILLPVDEDVVSPSPEPLGSSRHIPEPVRSFLVDCGAMDRTTYSKVDHQAQVMRTSEGLFYRNPRVTVVRAVVTPDHVRATAAAVSEARDQLADDAPGIVAVRAPDFHSEEQFGRVQREIHSRLRSTRRVSGVVLFHQAIVRTALDGEGVRGAMWWQLFWIANPRARCPLPENFAFECLPRQHGFELLNRPAS
jgi:hypothetical protein